MLRACEFLATLSGALFAGAAIYVNLVEHPARMRCGTELAATVWAPSYARATVMQASLAIVSPVSGAAAWLIRVGTLWLVGAVLIGLVVPFTFVAIMPTNKQLLAPGRDLASNETRALLERWGTLHAVRSVLSFVATLVFVWSLLGD
jgi:hypothetical protein